MSERRPIILVVEDESHIADLLQINLTHEGYETVLTDTGKKAIDAFKRGRVDLVVLDVMLPDANGTDLCRKFKHLKKDTPVLMLSALGQSSDRIKGLKSGADDYLAKPFNLEELFLRIEKLLGRFNNSESEIRERVLKIGSSSVHLDNYELVNGHTMYRLTSREVQLLTYLYQRRNKVVSRDEILQNVWGYDVYPNTRTIDNLVSAFRKYVGDDPANPRYFITVRGVGYKLAD